MCYVFSFSSVINQACAQFFLSYLKYAEYVLTNSFHGTAFSVIFEKNFYNFTSDFYSSRTTNILQQLGLLNRIPEKLDDVSLQNIDYSKILPKRQQLIEEAYSYLNTLEESV